MEGTFPAFGWECRQELTRLGHEVRLFDNKYSYLPGRAQTVWEYGTLARQLRLVRVNDAVVNRGVRRVAREFDPELILFSKCENLYASTVRYLRRHTSAVLINWNLDNPFHTANTSMAHLRSIELLDCYGAFAEHFIPVLRNLGCPRVEYWPCYYYPELHDASLTLDADEQERYGCDVAFAGNWSREREAVLTHLAGYQLAIWGPDWGSLQPASPLRSSWRGRAAVGSEYVKVLKGAKVVLNVMNMQGRGGNNLRTFEATGLGRLLLTEYSAEQAERLFVDGEEIVTYRSPGELREKLDYYLAHPEEAERIARRGQARTLRDHTLQSRLRDVLATAREIRGERGEEA
jgi:spore maturation protein CgeB